MRWVDRMRLMRWTDDRPRVPILLYHLIQRSGPVADPSMAVPQRRFDEQLAWLSEAGFQALTLSRVVDYVRGGRAVPPRSFALTFDDGFLSTYRLARPVLVRLGMPAAVFLVSNLLGKQGEWMHDEPSGPQLLMNADQVLVMRDEGFEFGSHGCTHTRMTRLDASTLTAELVRSREQLSRLLEREVETVAYPHGATDARVVRAARRAGYTSGLSVTAGWNHPQTDLMRLRRIVVTAHDTGASLLMKMILGRHAPRGHEVMAELGRTVVRGVSGRRQ